MEQVNGLARRFEDGILWIEIDRQEVGNSLTPDLHLHLTAWIEASSVDPAVRAVVLSGDGTDLPPVFDPQAERIGGVHVVVPGTHLLLEEDTERGADLVTRYVGGAVVG